MKITNLWSGILERIKGSKSRRKLADPLKDMPLIPSHKPKPAPGFSVVLINERRGPTQYDLTGKKFRFGIAGTVIIVCLAVFGVYSALKGLLGLSSIMADGYTRGIVDLAACHLKIKKQQPLRRVSPRPTHPPPVQGLHSTRQILGS